MEQRQILHVAAMLLLLVAAALGAGLLLLLIAAGLAAWLPGSALVWITRLSGLLLLLAPTAMTALGFFYAVVRGTILLWSLACCEWDRHLERQQVRVMLRQDDAGCAPLVCLPATDGYGMADSDHTPAPSVGATPSVLEQRLTDPRTPLCCNHQLVMAEAERSLRHLPPAFADLSENVNTKLPHHARMNGAAGDALTADAVAPLPEFIDLVTVLGRWRPTRSQLLLGVGAEGPIYADLQHVMHTGLGGATGWGKSAASLQLATQLALCPEVLLAVADPDAVSFQPLHDAGRLCLPLPASAADSKQVLEAIQEEIAARYRLIREGWRQSGVPLQSADDYNEWCAASGDTAILPLVLLVDEWPELVQLGAAGLAASIVKRGRKASVYAIVASQGWTRVDAGETGIRRQLHTVYQLGVKEAADARALVGTEGARRLWARIAAGRMRPGDALLQRAGPFPDVFVRVPYIEPRAATALLASLPQDACGGLVSNPGVVSPCERVFETQNETSVADVAFRNAETGFSASSTVSAFHENHVDPDKLSQIAALRAQGEGKTAIVRSVWEVTSGPRYQAAAREYDRYVAYLDHQHSV